MKTILLSSLVKVFKDSNLNHKEYTSASCLKNEKFSYQIAVIPSCEDGKELNISVSSPLKDYIKLYEVVNIPASVTVIEECAFAYSDSIKTVTVDQYNEVYDSRNNCNAIVETETNTLIFGCWTTTIPNTITAIGAHAFFGNENLSSINLPESIVSIGEAAFNGCEGLTSIIIPETVTTVEEHAFWGCSSLTDVYYTGTKAQWSTISVGDSNEALANATIHYNYVPEEN